MTEPFASGNWRVKKGKEEEFIDRWKDFLAWTRESQPSLVNASLMRDEQDPSHFVSFAEWKDTGGRDEWRKNPGFSEHLGACRALCDDFHGGDYDRVLTV